jgi:hypothetical protein
MPQQQQQQQNPAANWQRTYQNSQWARQAPQYQQNPYQQMPQQYQGQPYQQNPYQRQMPQQQQFQMPQFSQQQINQFLSYMQNRPMPNFMGDPRYQAQQSQKPVYQPTQQPAMNPRAYVPDVKFTYGGGMGVSRNSYTSGDAAADAWVKQRNVIDMSKAGVTQQQREQKTRDLYNQYYAGAQ